MRQDRKKLAQPVAISLLTLLVLGGFVVNCQRNQPPKPVERPNALAKNVLFIVIDSLRADHLGAYGYDKPTSPRLDQFAADNVMFTQAYAAAPWTLPSHASMFTGLYPMTHGAELAKYSLLRGIPTLAEALKSQGYQTGAVICAPFMREGYRLNAGFDIYDTKLIYSTAPAVKADKELFRKGKGKKLAFDVTDMGLEYLDKVGDKPFFLFLHYWDVHHPYNPAQKYVDMFDPGYTGDIDGFDVLEIPEFVPGMDPADLKHMLALYDGEIRYTDDGLTKLLAEVERRGLLENTLVIITSDHGDEFLEHGGRTHMTQLWQETIHIPLLMHIPGLDVKGRKIDTPVSHVDFFPTILDLLGLNGLPKRQHGLSLNDLIRTGKPLPRRDVLSQTVLGTLKNPRGGKRGVWTVAITPELVKFHRLAHVEEGFKKIFEVSDDPLEQNDLSAERKDEFREFMKNYHKYSSRYRNELEAIKKGTAQRQEVMMEPAFKKQLRDLGYL